MMERPGQGMMNRADLLTLSHDTGGKGAMKFAVITCLVATGVAMYSPAFKTNPLLSGPLNEIRQKLPETFDTLRRAMGG